MKKVILIVVASIICSHLAVAQIIYPDNNLPADTPRVFAKDIISTGLANRDLPSRPQVMSYFIPYSNPNLLQA